MLLKKVIVPLYINILYIIFKYIVLLKYIGYVPKLKIYVNFLKPQSEMHHTPNYVVKKKTLYHLYHILTCVYFAKIVEGKSTKFID